MCSRGAEQKIRRRREKEAQESTTVSFQAYGRSMETMTALKYLVRVLTTSGDYWMAVVANLREVRRKWARLSSIWYGERSDP